DREEEPLEPVGLPKPEPREAADHEGTEPEEEEVEASGSEELKGQQREAEQHPQPPGHVRAHGSHEPGPCQTEARPSTRQTTTSVRIQKPCAPTVAAGTRRSSRPATAKPSGNTCQSRVVSGERMRSRTTFSQPPMACRRASVASLHVTTA